MVDHFTAVRKLGAGTLYLSRAQPSDALPLATPCLRTAHPELLNGSLLCEVSGTTASQSAPGTRSSAYESEGDISDPNHSQCLAFFFKAVSPYRPGFITLTLTLMGIPLS